MMTQFQLQEPEYNPAVADCGNISLLTALSKLAMAVVVSIAAVVVTVIY